MTHEAMRQRGRSILDRVAKRLLLPLFEASLEGTDAHATSFNERNATESHDGTEFTYGEVSFPFFIPLIEFVDPKEGEILFDLGCGSGRPMMIAAMAFPQLQTCIGIELMPKVYELGSQVVEKFNKIIA